MTAELTALTLAGLLQVVQYTLYSAGANRQAGLKTALGPRDQKVELRGRAGRLQRALNNHFEGLIMFTLAVVVVTLGEKSSALTEICAWTYLAARILYIPAYVVGKGPWRSAIWMLGLLAIITMLMASLLT